MRLLFDTETSGLVRADLDALHPSQPALVQLGAQLFDQQWVKRGHLTVLIKPDGWEIEPQAEAVHGISTSTCHRYGVSLAEALVTFRGLVMCSSRVIAHHAEFDRKIITTALHRLGANGHWWARSMNKLFCTMEAATPVCRIESEFGFKFPSLEEAVKILCPEADLPVKHDADSDIAACGAVYKALLAGGHAIEVSPFAINLETHTA